MATKEFEPPLDAGIREYVEALVEEGVETFESCQGGDGHCYPEPTIRFHGQQGAGYAALAVALERGFPVRQLRRCWDVESGELTGPSWELVLWPAQASA